MQAVAIKGIKMRLLAISFVAWISIFCVPLTSAQDKSTKPKPRPTSPVVSVAGVDFAIEAESNWILPAEVYGEFNPEIALRIHNKTERELVFHLGDRLRLSLKTVDGPELVLCPIPKQDFAKPITIAAGKSQTLAIPAFLLHTRIHDISLGMKTEMLGMNWLTRDLKPGQYQLRMSLEHPEDDKQSWKGKMQTNAIEIKIKKEK